MCAAAAAYMHICGDGYSPSHTLVFHMEKRVVVGSIVCNKGRRKSRNHPASPGRTQAKRAPSPSTLTATLWSFQYTSTNLNQNQTRRKIATFCAPNLAVCMCVGRYISIAWAFGHSEYFMMEFNNILRVNSILQTVISCILVQRLITIIFSHFLNL